MSNKKVSYVKLLKEAIAEFDTSKTVDMKGPMLDPIISYDGAGELPTHKDAASILERYYFNEDADQGITVDALEEHEDNVIDEVPDENIEGAKKDIEKEVTEQEEVAEPEEEEEKKEEEERVEEQDEMTPEEEKEKEEAEKELEEVGEDVEVENAVIEKLIGEMEEEGDEGAGTEAAGTGTAEKEVPPDKDKGEGYPVKAAEISEQDEEKGEEELDVDKEMGEEEEEVEEQFAGQGPGSPEDMTGDEEELEEAFQIFKEQIEDEEEEEEEEEVEEQEEKKEEKEEKKEEKVEEQVEKGKKK